MLTAGIFGWPVAHSKSPIIHRFWLAKLGLDGDYSRFAVHPDNVGAAVRALPALGVRGVNVTVPHKVTVMAFLDEIDPAAQRVGAVNTVVVSPDGHSAGINTDVAGVLAALPEAMLRPGMEVCLIGTGGAARAALAAFKQRGVSLVLFKARDQQKAWALLTEFGFGGCVEPIDDERGHAIRTAELIVNATSLGMTGQDDLPQSVFEQVGDALSGEVPVFDMVYAPLETSLLATARRNGLPTVDGLAMLIGQAAAAFELFYDAPAPRQHDAELRELLAA